MTPQHGLDAQRFLQDYQRSRMLVAESVEKVWISTITQPMAAANFSPSLWESEPVQLRRPEYGQGMTRGYWRGPVGRR